MPAIDAISLYLCQGTFILLGILWLGFIFSYGFQLNIDKAFILNNLTLERWSTQTQSTWLVDRSCVISVLCCCYDCGCVYICINVQLSIWKGLSGVDANAIVQNWNNLFNWILTHACICTTKMDAFYEKYMKYLN